MFSHIVNYEIPGSCIYRKPGLLYNIDRIKEGFMGAQSHAQHEKVKVTFECSIDERTYIKMLAAKGRMTISEFLLSHVRSEFPGEPNSETKKAMLDSRKRKNLGSAKSMDEFWEQMGVTKKPRSGHQAAR